MEEVCGKNTEPMENVAYSILFLEYFGLVAVLGWFFRASYRLSVFNFKEFRIYLGLVSVSAVLKVMMFFDTCVSYEGFVDLLIFAYEIPYFSGEALVIYLW
jgi:hypothetical protein